MAKGKHARALFEVIKQSQEAQSRKQRRNRPAARGGESLSAAILSWFKRRPADGDRATAVGFDDTDDTTSRPIASPLIRPVMREIPQTDPVSQELDPQTEAAPGAEPALADDGPSAGVESRAESDIPPAPAHDAGEDEFYSAHQPTSHDTAITTALTGSGDDELADSAETEEPAQPMPPRPSRRTRDRQLNLVLSYPSLIVSGIAAVLLLTVAFLAGRHSGSRTPTLAELQSGKPSPAVLDVGRDAGKPTLSTPTEPPVDQVVNTVPRESRPAAGANAPAANPAGEIAVPTGDRRRVVGRNYIIAQSYPDPDNAEKAAALLNRSNIPVTVEQLDAAPGWYCVVTEVGFDRVSTPECERYQRLIKDMNAHTRSARLKAFEPYLYKWK